MLTTMGSLVKHAEDVLALLDVILLLKQISMIHCLGHQKGEDSITKGNRAANEAAKKGSPGRIISWSSPMRKVSTPAREASLPTRGGLTGLQSGMPN
jgi:hypothetical protein